MKKIFILSAILSLALATISCEKDYLQTSPTSSTSPSTIFASTENAKLAINGINRLMVSQWIGSQGFNGEGTVKLYHGEYPGNDLFVNLTGWANTINGKYHTNRTVAYDYFPWLYYYKLIANANTIIANIDGAEGTDDERNFIKAQALTYRAYCYTMLVQLYCPRWTDSQNGTYNLDKTGVVIRTTPANDEDKDMPASASGAVYTQIYADLDEAIKLFGESSEKRTENYEVNIDVAYATYARAALTKQDYSTALTYAKLARKDYPLMSVSDYKSGFFSPTSEWIWSSYGGTTQNLYYYSYQAYVAYNSTASAVRTTPKCISRQLFDQISDNDIRKALFLDPQKDSYTKTSGKAGTALNTRGRTYAAADGRLGIASNATVFAYMQLKIACEDVPGIGWLNHFRSSEMVLIEAEANYFLKNESAAQNALVELNATSKRYPGYTCSLTGEDLLNEIKLYRRIELWGEGFNWFDYKRWGDTVSRKTYDEGGNFFAAIALDIAPDAENAWTWMIPEKEYQYNDSID